MPPKAKFTKAEIIEAALNIVRADGYETLQTLMQKEQSLSMMMDELSKIIFRPIQELYKD